MMEIDFSHFLRNLIDPSIEFSQAHRCRTAAELFDFLFDSLSIFLGRLFFRVDFFFILFFQDLEFVPALAELQSSAIEHAARKSKYLRHSLQRLDLIAQSKIGRSNYIIALEMAACKLFDIPLKFLRNLIDQLFPFRENAIAKLGGAFEKFGLEADPHIC